MPAGSWEVLTCGSVWSIWLLPCEYINRHDQLLISHLHNGRSLGCVSPITIMLILMKQNPDVEEARKERKSKLSLPPSSSPSNVCKQEECTQEELDKYLEKLNHVFFDIEARKRDGHPDQKSLYHRSPDVVSETKEQSGKEVGHSASVKLHKSSGRRLKMTLRLNPR